MLILVLLSERCAKNKMSYKNKGLNGFLGCCDGLLTSFLMFLKVAVKKMTASPPVLEEVYSACKQGLFCATLLATCNNKNLQVIVF
ncbi:hypothetical protein A3742_27360 [Oleiphilus sp. HI0071]|nr:hypothetical protein A3737_03975 [Oleiphilus sp. HI0065]KZY83053.1 hypothetical protein A3742_01120 [Oleiphilus sp. HI0071]KZY90493.1 hypothetical protein A3744_21535 [Oleiphilus sp. HI0073]KZZ18171.1 hypothetical protein A3751_09250 [Oleiphilus sp. HI0080]KZZ40759.1 hypothetical protein A3758_08565 [Oleiphilus sp. HI0118]KZZ48934.1 hypothetical protein A3760_22380 [Oleiphilus sp. HI0122]KZZ77753.1 hypothetical protein A3767_14200 [Oleiphilus sp. HI0133]